MAIKKTLAFLSVFIVAMLLVGCGAQKEQPIPTSTITQQTAPSDSTGLDQSAVAQEQQDLSTEELSDIDAGLGEIEKI